MPQPHTIGSRAGSVAADGAPEHEVRLGFVALTDCAPLVIAKERGFFRKHGLRVTLVREPSWANIRDKVQAGLLDGAQMLAPMPIASTLGVDGASAPMVAPLSLGLNGNAITVSRSLHERMLRADPEAMAERPISARALRAVLRAERDEGRPPLRFAVVFPFSPHHYELCYWMGSAGIDPARDVELSVIPPAAMAARLREGEIDGYCVGEPWNQLAAEERTGRSLITKYEIWNNSPEKVLAFTADWVERRPETCRAVLRAVIEAAQWVDRPEHRLETVHVIAGESFVDAPVGVVARSMGGRFELGEGADVPIPDFNVFHRYAATFPWVSHAMWFATQMIRWGQVEKPFSVRALASQVYRPDLYREAAEEIGQAFPEIDEKVEGVHGSSWWLEQATEPIRMGPDLFFDRRRFDPHDVVRYLEQCEVTRLRLRLDDLVCWNA